MNQRTSTARPRPATSDRSALLDGDPWRVVGGGVVETTVLLTTDLLAGLESAASQRKMSVGRLVRELIKHHLASVAVRPPDGRPHDQSPTPEAVPGAADVRE